ncbi:uncharacterized protein LOC133791669 [Humulus lupulus]|uniref:uncharacterized protein LOC133791669 n=1 Tax=Humulus lupulus TaxID=3486 RepID=UPI002B40A51E|nr:uncharacterized protein LOC133791669 [Humulus lupulus]
MKGNKVQDLMNNTFRNWDFDTSPVTEGRILIIWRKTFVKVSVLEENKQFVHCHIKMPGQKCPFTATFIYGLNTLEEMKVLWLSLSKIARPVSSWIILGDFNAIFTAKDRSGDKVKAAVETFRTQEHMYHSFLAQRSKITLLKKGDMNMAYFHAYLKKRREANKIATYISEQGRVVDNFSKVEIGSEVCRAVIQFFETGIIPEELLETTMSLVPKIENPTRAVDYRPIACCSTLYKCISKLLCYRLAKVLPDLVYPNQGTFIQGRSIAHNVLICQDLIKNYRRSSISPRCAIKIDISKAYDTIDWWFIEELLKSLCFLARFIGWVMTCLRNTSYLLLMNGRVQGRFKGEEGLRQGDPISPLLFVLIMDYLTRSLQLAAQGSVFRYHPMCKSLQLISLCFADDLLLFCKGTLSTVKVLKNVIGEFSSVTRLQINESKSQIYFGGVSAVDKHQIAAEMNLSEGAFPLKYLGVPMRPTKWKHEDCDIIIQKIKMRLHTWASRHLSFASRIQLIHSVLFGLRNYWMSDFVLPQSIIKEVEKLYCGFLWGVNGNRSNIHMASWEKVCLPKAYGGLKFRNGLIWNYAILAKYIWVISEKHDMLWVKWINSIYLKGSNFWSYKLPLDTSWYWRKLCNLRGKFSCDDIKSAGISGKFQASILYNSSLNQQQVVNSQLLTCDNMIRFNVPLDSLMCPVCGRYAESHSHIFFDCILSKQILDLIFDWMAFRAWPTEFDSWRIWLSSRSHGVLFHITNMILAAVVYSIWRNRNRCVCDNYSRTAVGIATDIKTTIQHRLYFVKYKKLTTQEQRMFAKITM